jgi:signal peptidase I
VTGSEEHGTEERGAGQSAGSLLRETLIVVVGALLVAIVVRTFLIQAFYIPSGSMEQTLQLDDRVLVSKLSTRWGDIQRGEVVVFHDPADWITPIEQPASGAGAALREALTFIGLLPSASGDDLVKRVIGIGGDRVVCCDATGKITVNGTPLEEDYLFPGNVPSETPFDVTVPAGRLWLMGDHREVSQDSRYHEAITPGSGMVPEDSVIGRAVLVVWPFPNWAVLSIPSGFDAVAAAAP